MSRLGRFTVNAEGRKFLGPFGVPVRLDIYAMSKLDDETTAGRAYLSMTKKEADQSLGCPMEPGTKVVVDLDPGEELWAVSTTTSLLAYVIRGFYS